MLPNYTFSGMLTVYQQWFNSDRSQSMEKASGGRSMDGMTEMLIRLYVPGTAPFTCEWILGKWEASPEELAAVYEQTLPTLLQKSLR